MNDDLNPTPIEEDPAVSRRTMLWALTAIIVIGFCLIFMLAFTFFQPGGSSLRAKYFPSPTATRRPASTPAPTRTLAPNLTATQQAWIKPDQPPTLGTSAETQKGIDSSTTYLEGFALTTPDIPDVSQPGDIYIYDIQLDAATPAIWSYGWCTTTNAILEENLTHMQIEFSLNEKSVSLENLFIHDTARDDGSPCRNYDIIINQWSAGQHHLEVHITFTQPTDDGWNLYPAGTHTFKYIVTVN